MSTQEIIAEIEKLDPLERARVITYLRQLDQPPSKDPAAESEESEEEVWDVLEKYAGTMPELPEDMSVNHDHYLYGTPKRKP